MSYLVASPTSQNEDEFAANIRRWKESLRPTGYNLTPEKEQRNSSEKEAVDADDKKERLRRMSASSKSDRSSSTDEEKADLAVKAKLKFLENLHKFQRKASEQRSSFQRSYLGSSERSSEYLRNARSSSRQSSSRRSSNHTTRRSLRKQRSSDDVFLDDDPPQDKNSYDKTRKNKESFSNGSYEGFVTRSSSSEKARRNSYENTNKERITHSRKVTSSNEITPMPGTDRLSSNLNGSHAPLSEHGKALRAEPAAVKSISQSQNSSASSQGKTNLNYSPTPSAKPRRPHEMYERPTHGSPGPTKPQVTRKNTDDEWFDYLDTTGEWFSISHMDDTPLAAVIQMLTNDLRSPTLQPDRQTLSMEQSAGEINDDHHYGAVDSSDEDQDVFGSEKNRNFETADTKEPIATRGIIFPKPCDRGGSKAVADLSTSATTIPSKQQVGLQDRLHHQQGNTKNWQLANNKGLVSNEPIEVTNLFTDFRVENQGQLQFAKSKAAETAETDPFFSGNFEFESSTHTANTNINYNAEEAIDTFRKLSQEIDLIKSLSFRQSVAESRLKSDSAASKSKLSLSHPSKSVHKLSATTPSNFSKDPDDLAGNLPDNYCSNDLCLSGSIASLTGEIKDKERNKKEKEKERDETFSENSAHTNECNYTINEQVINDINTAQEQHIKSLQRTTSSIVKELEFDTKTSKASDESKSLLKNKANSSIKRGKKAQTMSGSVDNLPVERGSSLRFRKMSSAQRREKLRQVVLRHRSEPTQSDSDSSLLSDASSNASDIDMDWLEEGETDEPVFQPFSENKAMKKLPSQLAKPTQTKPVTNGSTSNNHVNGDHSSQDHVGNISSRWKSKTTSSDNPARSSPVIELDGVRKKVNETKALWAAPSTTNKIPARQRRHLSLEKDKVDSNGDSDAGSRPVKVGSMLSMWENKKVEKRAAYNATEDEAFTSNTVGRLKGAKALFENMSKQNSSDRPLSRIPKGDGSSLPQSSTSIKDVKNRFETKSQGLDATKSLSAKKSRGELPVTTKSPAISKSRSKFTSKQEDLTSSLASSFSTSSSVAPKGPVEDRSTRRKDELPSGDTDSLLSSSSSSEKEQTTTYTRTQRRRNRAKDVAAMNHEDRPAKASEQLDERKKTNKSASDDKKLSPKHDDRKSASKPKMPSAEITSSKPSSPTKARPAGSIAAKSNIQSKISTRRKRDRRPMTQPITVDDVTSAKQFMKNQEPSSDLSSRGTDTSSQEEEKTLSFSERLDYFNQLIARSKTAEPEENSCKRRHRGSSKRFLTQPIDRDAVAQAKELQRNSEAARSQVDQAKDSVVEKESVTTSEAEPAAVPVGKANITKQADLTCVDGLKEDTSAEVEVKPQKVGKLSSELKTKFLESQTRSNLPSEATPRRSPRPIRRNKFSESPSASPPGVQLDNKPIEIPPGLRNSLHLEEDTNSEDSDMGKNREAEIKATGSIHDRLKLLEKNKEEGWKKKVKGERKGVKSSLEDRLSQLHDSEDKWKKSKPSPAASTRASTGSANKAKISDRLNSIMANSENWKSKMGKQNDATQFTVQAKIAKRDGVKVAPVPAQNVIRKPQPVTVKEDAIVTVKDVSSDAPSLNKLSEVLKLSQKGLEPEVIKTTESSTTEIPDMVNDDFVNFFNTNKLDTDEQHVVTSNGTHSDTENTPAWFDDDVNQHQKVNAQLSDLGRMKARVQRPSSRKKRSNRNPVKALAARTDIKQSYTEHRSNISKLEQQRIASKHGYGANFTAAAIAGLAAKADLSKVNLRSTKKTTAFSASDHKPWKEKMLLRVKGRRHVQTRLVEPVAASLNSGDAYLLILPDKLFAWYGDFSNVIEKAKVSEIADYIIHKGDLGSKATSLHVIKEEQSSTIRAKEFWNLLGGRGNIEPSGGAEEDELFEVNAEATIKSYKLEDSKLIPHKASWGKLPTMAQLSATSTFVFDFGAEMYIWHGKEVSFDDRQIAIKLARALWDQGYDYTDVGFCPFLPLSQSTKKVKGPRPDWGLFARVTENLETALVQEKFEDWSNIAREIGDREEVLKESSRGQVASEMKIKTNITPDMTSCDVNKMKENKSMPQPLLLEGYNMWKGHGIIYDEDGRGLRIVTNSVNVWQATDKALIELENEQIGIFYRCETYVVRWRYVVSSTGKWKAKASSGGDLKNDPKGRERVAYFLWPGSESTVNEKGASALMATEIDKEIGSQVVITEGKEPPAFSQCFSGGLIVVDGKRGSREGFYSWKLFCVRGSNKEETILHQVPCNVTSLRSRTSFVAVYGRQGKVVIWHGAKSPEQTRELATHAAKQIQKEKRTNMGFRHTCKLVSIEECEEEDESSDFKEAMGRIRRSKYMSLAGFKNDKTPCPRLWHMYPSKDEFVAKELHPVLDTIDEGDTVINCFPYSQKQLKELNQPAFVLLDNSEGVYLWQSSCDEELTGSAKRQFDISRRLAMETTVNYCKSFRTKISPLLVHEYHEPVEFTNSFPIWKEPDQKISFDEKRAKKPQPLEEILETVCRLTYTLEELRASPLPEGVDPNHLETYLSSHDFDELFQMSKEDFYSLPPWKQQNLRKEKNLF